MQIHPIVRDQEAFLREVAVALAHQNTRFYLDTNVLMWLVGIGPLARKEFIEWCNACPSGIVNVPVWVCHEFQKHLSQDTVASNIGKTFSSSEAEILKFVDFAIQRIDDSLAFQTNFQGREGYISDLLQSYERLNRLRVAVQPNRETLREAAQEVVKFANQRALDTDLRPIIAELSQNATFRCLQKIPPGFEDARHGDAIIWSEILADLDTSKKSGVSPPSHGIFVSNDDKVDWVSHANMVKTARGIEGVDRPSGRDVTLPHPLLLHELSMHVRDCPFFVLNCSSLAFAIEDDAKRAKRPSGIDNWVSSTRMVRSATRRQQLGAMLKATSQSTALQVEMASSTDGRREDEIPAQVLPADSRPDNARSVVMIDVLEEKLAYQAADDAGQVALEEEWRTKLQARAMTPLKLGRLIAELALLGLGGLPITFMRWVESLVNTIPLAYANDLVVSYLCAAYFDSAGNALTYPKIDIGNSVMGLALDPRFADAFATVGSFVQEGGAKLPWPPGTLPAHETLIRITAAQAPIGEPRDLTSVKLASYEVIETTNDEQDSRRLVVLLNCADTHRCTEGQLAALVAKEFLVPIEYVQTQNPLAELRLRSDQVLLPLDTDSEGGIGELGDGQ